MSWVSRMNSSMGEQSTREREHTRRWGAWGGVMPERVEHSVAYFGETASGLSFFHQFPQIIFRYHGSALVHIWPELVIAVSLGPSRDCIL